MSNETLHAGDLTRSIMDALDMPADDPETRAEQAAIKRAIDTYVADRPPSEEEVELAHEVMREIDALPLSAHFVAQRAGDVADAPERMYARAHAVATRESGGDEG